MNPVIATLNGLYDVTNVSVLTDPRVRARLKELLDISSGGGDLATTLALGNTTGGNNIQISSGDDIILNGLTHSRIAGIGAAKEITSLDTTTYPNLTELSYLKGTSSTVQTQLNTKQSIDGWVSDSNTWTYSSADSPTFIISINADVTTTISVGMKIRLVQTTTKYFIVTAVGAFSAGATLVTVYGGTDYTLANAAISSPYYSPSKTPFGFNTSPLKWMVEVTDTGNRTQSSPVAATVYNPGAITISIPIGAWRVMYNAHLECSLASATAIQAKMTLSTANNTESDTEFSNYGLVVYASGISGRVEQVNFKEKNLLLAAKTSYFLNVIAVTASTADISIRGDLTKTIIRAYCAYL